MNIITAHRTVTPDDDWFTADNVTEKNGYGTLDTTRVLPGTIRVRRSHDDVLKSVQMVVEMQVFFDGQLGNPIGTFRVCGGVFSYRQSLRTPVDSPSGRDKD